MLKQFEEYYEKHFDELIKSLGEIMSIDSSFGTPMDGKPFGDGSARALAWAEDFGRRLGLNVRNIDNYCVVMDWGENPKLGILSHLDVVPAGEGWTYEPFACTLDGDYICGRGAIDDKGPSVAVLYAVKCLIESGFKPVHGIRLIMGGNEEGGCEDIAYYAKKEKFPPMVVTPDGSFPILNCEKGMLHLEFKGSGKFSVNGLDITEIKGGTVVNAIPGKTVCKARYDTLPSFPDCEAEKSEDGFTLIGQSSHGSRPELGRNTVTALIDTLAKNGCELACRLGKIFPHGEFDGKSAGMGFSDEVSGTMTCALTVLNFKNESFTAGIDIRYPIDRRLADIQSIITDALKLQGFEVTSADGMEPHYVPEDSELVQTLLKTYEKVKGEKGYCIAEGGVTYVHETEGGVAFGAEFPNENNNMHGADEHISLDTLKCNFLMYAEAINEICG